MDYGRQGNNYYGRGRSPSPRERFRHDASRGRDNYGRRDEGWARGGDRREPDRRAPERYSSSWRSDAPDRPPSGGYRSRSPSQGRNRSRSGSRGRVHYRNDSRSPRRRSLRRSSSHESRRRFKRGSSSSSRSSSNSISRRSKHDTKEDIFNSMYADREVQRQPTAYLHPSLNKSAMDIVTTQTPHTASIQSAENITAHAQAILTTAGFATALSQAYGGNSPKKSNARHDIDDEDRFLYGDDDAGPKVEKPAPPAQVQPKPVSQPTHPAPAKNTNVTPGGFDSNALKNVLKAIGFDFEMSEQQSHGTQPVSLKETPPTPVPVSQPARPPPCPAGEVPQRIQTISSVHPSQQIHPARAPPPPQAPPQHQYFQPYDPYNPESYTAQPPVQHPIEHRPTNMGYPITIQDPNNPGNTLIVYRSMNQSTQPQAVYQQPVEPPVVTQQGGRVVLPHMYQQPAEQPVVTQQGGRVVLPHAYQQPAEQPPFQTLQGGGVVLPIYHQPAEQPAVQTQQGGRVVLPPHRQDSIPAVEKNEKEIRQERLNYLQTQLEKLKKQQNELLRKKRREKDGHKDPLIKKNTMLQAGVEEQIREITQAAERAAGIESESSDDDDAVNKKVGKEGKSYNYFDPGKHWCQMCGIFSEDLAAYLSHLHSKTHRKAIDPYDRPWDEGEKKKKQKDVNAHSKALKGSEFLIPVTGYYCKLCQIFSGDQMCADDHLKSYEHNAIYKKHCKKNQSYEKKYKKKKKAALELITNGDKKKEDKREPVKTEVKFVDTPVKKEKEPLRYVEKEPPRYVEKEPPRHVVKEPSRYVEKEPPRYVEKKSQRYVVKESPKYVEKESPRYVEKESPRFVVKEAKYVEKQMKFSDQQVKYVDQSSYVNEKPFGLDKREKKHMPRDQSREQSADIGRESGRRVYDRGDNSARHDIGKILKKFSERPQRTPDHGGRKRNWSPGYDEYERQQQDERYGSREKRRNEQDEKQSQRSRSRDRGERWVEKTPQGFNKRSDLRRPNKESMAAGAKIPTPGFGKFHWNSGAKNDAFDQVPVDNLVPTREKFDKNGEFSGKGKIAIKITGKTQYPPRLSTSSALSKNISHSAVEEKRASMALELQRKVAALKRENALRNQLSSIVLPSGRTTKQLQQPKPNTAAVMMGTRSIGKHNTLLLAKKNTRHEKKDEEEIITHHIEVDVSPPPTPQRPRQRPRPGNAEPPPPGNSEPPPPGEFEPPPPGVFEPLPPGEEEITMGGIDADANSDVSGISMEIASDEDCH